MNPDSLESSRSLSAFGSPILGQTLNPALHVVQNEAARQSKVETPGSVRRLSSCGTSVGSSVIRFRCKCLVTSAVVSIIRVKDFLVFSCRREFSCRHSPVDLVPELPFPRFRIVQWLWRRANLRGGWWCCLSLHFRTCLEAVG